MRSQLQQLKAKVHAPKPKPQAKPTQLKQVKKHLRHGLSLRKGLSLKKIKGKGRKPRSHASKPAPKKAARAKKLKKLVSKDFEQTISLHGFRKQGPVFHQSITLKGKYVSASRAKLLAKLAANAQAKAKAHKKHENLKHRLASLDIQINLNHGATKIGAQTPVLAQSVAQQMAEVHRLRLRLALIAQYLDDSNEDKSLVSRKSSAMLEVEALALTGQATGAGGASHVVSLVETQVRAQTEVHVVSLSESDSEAELFRVPGKRNVPRGAAFNAFDAIRLQVVDRVQTPNRTALCVTVTNANFASKSVLSLQPCASRYREAQVLLYNQLSGHLRLAEFPEHSLQLSRRAMTLTSRTPQASAVFDVSLYKQDPVIVYDSTEMATGCWVRNTWSQAGDVVVSSAINTIYDYRRCLRVEAVPTSLVSECQILRQEARGLHTKLDKALRKLRGVSPQDVRKAVGKASHHLQIRLAAIQFTLSGYSRALAKATHLELRRCQRTQSVLTLRKNVTKKQLKKAFMKLAALVAELKRARFEMMTAGPQLRADKEERKGIERSIREIQHQMSRLENEGIHLHSIRSKVLCDEIDADGNQQQCVRICGHPSLLEVDADSEGRGRGSRSTRSHEGRGRGSRSTRSQPNCVKI